MSFDRAVRARLTMRSLLLQGCWNYECMQNLGFAFALAPWLRRIERRGGPKALDGLRRHLEYFNTQPYMASFVLGVTARLEESLAAAPAASRPALAARISRLKAGFGSALAALGDALFWGTLRPLCAALALALWLIALAADAPCPAAWAAAAYLLLFNAPALWVRWKGLELGYAWGESAAVELKRFRWQERIRVLRWTGFALALGLGVYGALEHPWSPSPWANAWVLPAAVAARAAGITMPRLYGMAVLAGVLAGWAGA